MKNWFLINFNSYLLLIKILDISNDIKLIFFRNFFATHQVQRLLENQILK